MRSDRAALVILRIALALVLAALGAGAGLGCQSILGIRASQVARNDAGTGGTVGAVDASDASDDDAGIASVTTDAAKEASSDLGSHADAGLADAASAEGGERDMRPDVVGSDATVLDGGPKADAGIADAGIADAGIADAGTADAGKCTSPWHVENVPARIFAPTAGGTACNLAGSAIPKLAAGLDTANFRGAAACGACLRVQTTTGSPSVIVSVVEVSQPTGILLTREAMNQIAAGADQVNVDWTLVPCEVATQPVRYYFKEGVNANYLALQVRNARYPLASVSVVGTHLTVPLSLKSYNYWESAAAGAGPLTLRVTDINGQTFDDAAIKVVPQTVVGKGQLPVCR